MTTSRFICTNPRHSHGSGCYRTCKCRCDVCRRYNSEYRKLYQRERNILEGRNVWISSAPSARRLRALARIGWSSVEIERRYGIDRATVGSVRRGDRPHVRRTTHRIVKRAYEELSMTPAEGKSATFARLWAEKQGWPSPLALDEQSINTPWRGKSAA